MTSGKHQNFFFRAGFCIRRLIWIDTKAVKIHIIVLQIMTGIFTVSIDC